jgi:long-chain acyl-CoA synthetase
VILWAVNRPEWGIAFFAIVHAGAVAVPLDVRHTVDFGRKIVAQTEARLVIASRQTEASAKELGLPIVWLESQTRPVVLNFSRRLRWRGHLADRPTSGTTGEPEGRDAQPRHLMASATMMTSPVAGVRDRLPSVLPLSHLYEQVLGLLLVLMVGASVVYPVSRQPAVLMRTFRDFKVSILLIVPQGLCLIDAIERRSTSRPAAISSGPLRRATSRGRSGDCSSARSWPSSVAGCTRSGLGPRPSTSTSPGAGRRWALTSSRATARPRWARS